MAPSQQQGTTPDIIKKLVADYLDGRADAVWQHAQSKQWLIKHRDLEIVAAKAGIEFDLPTVLEHQAGVSVALVVAGRLKDRMEWSIGEATPKNTQQAYPYAMAEKRAKDRVILKLMNIHGHIYSEEEMADEAKSSKAQPLSGPSEKEKADRVKAEGKIGHIRTNLAPLDSFEQAEWLKANPDEVKALQWVKRKYPDLYAEISGLGVEV
ncbi:trna delta -isopentenylpyrophosphate transferase [Rhizobium leguminosarum]|uniref:trna delta -isopentenylpyrophosphate transferase n=1 Tax=Rhizobium leguminosarum TaxID=384 RepID=UPI001C97E035|nr:trna delta -isopentenylpyrophosphate transferase [Rhizobium leguminosarum]MBY5594125.1 trna delta -isopentenylpyrophosphate transferase [Rhizobium leguminosarum]